MFIFVLYVTVFVLNRLFVCLFADSVDGVVCFPVVPVFLQWFQESSFHYSALFFYYLFIYSFIGCIDGFGFYPL